jgi:hypothetical protein
MRRLLLPVASMVLIAACAGESGPESTTSDGADDPAAATAATGDGGTGDGSTGDGSTGDGVVNPQPPGQGAASVDGQEFTFNTPGGIACSVAEEEFSFSYIIGDNEVTIGGGASIQGGQWFGSLSMRVTSDDQTVEYVAQLNDNPGAVAVDGNSVSYAGPMEKYLPAPPGELPQGIDVGSGVFTTTCG